MLQLIDLEHFLSFKIKSCCWSIFSVVPDQISILIVSLTHLRSPTYKDMSCPCKKLDRVRNPIIFQRENFLEKNVSRYLNLTDSLQMVMPVLRYFFRYWNVHNWLAYIFKLPTPIEYDASVYWASVQSLSVSDPKTQF